MLGGQCRGRAPYDHQVHLETHKVWRQGREAVSAIGRPIINIEILPLDISKSSQPLPERGEIGDVQGRRRRFQYADAQDARALLGARAYRPSKGRGAEQAYEGAPGQASTGTTFRIGVTPLFHAQPSVDLLFGFAD